MFIRTPSADASNVGYIASMSIGGVPAIAKAPPSIAPRQWRHIYEIGVSTAPKLALASASAFAYAAYSMSRLPNSTVMFSIDDSVLQLSTAAVSTVMIMPWTLATMLPTNAKLDGKLAKADAGSTANEDNELQELLHKWAKLNGVRSGFPLLGALIGLWVITS